MVRSSSWIYRYSSAQKTEREDLKPTVSGEDKQRIQDTKV